MERVRLYGPTYGGFDLDARAQVRAETYGEDLGQNSWLTLDEWRALGEWLAPEPGARVLDVACGSGGPAVHLARERQAEVVGVDASAEAVATATATAESAGSTATFRQADASQPLPFGDGEFDAIVCIDAINHLAGRAAVLADWHRLLRPGGRLAFTDPVVVTGIVTSEELAARSSIGIFLFSLVEEDERLLREAGFALEGREDTTHRVAEVAGRWSDARAARRDALVADEGEETFEGLQAFLSMTHVLAAERRLSRFTFLACR